MTRVNHNIALGLALLTLALLLKACDSRAGEVGSWVVSFAFHLTPQMADALTTDYCVARSTPAARCRETNPALFGSRDASKAALGVALALGDHELGRHRRLGRLLQWGLRVADVAISVVAVERNLGNAARVNHQSNSPPR